MCFCISLVNQTFIVIIVKISDLVDLATPVVMDGSAKNILIINKSSFVVTRLLITGGRKTSSSYSVKNPTNEDNSCRYKVLDKLL